MIPHEHSTDDTWVVGLCCLCYWTVGCLLSVLCGLQEKLEEDGCAMVHSCDVVVNDYIILL